MRKHHGWTVRFAALGGALAILASAPPAAAQTQIKPYMLLIFDNSGSMDGTPLTQAKTAVRNMVSSAGDVIFGLERFQTTCTTCTAGACTWRGCSSGLSCPTPNGVYRANEGQILAGFGEDNQTQVLRWVDGTCTGGDAGADPELWAVTWTPLHGSLDTALLYYRDGGTWVSTAYTSAISTDPYRGCRPYYVIMLTDGDETCGGCPQNGATALRSTRMTTLACTTVADCCPAGTCRTTGAGTPSCVTGRCQYDVMTWDIGFRTAVPYATMENIAIAGGTDCPGTNRACYASDATSLSAALSDIVASSVLVEICDGADNDCDGLIDEGFVKYCNRPSHPAQDLCADPGETLCDGIDNNCDGRTDEGLLNACGTCGATPTEICDLLDNDCDGSVDEGGVCGGCVPGAEVCDNADNDCDGLTDEGLTRPCGTSIGQCTPGTQTCSAGTWGTCAGSTPPTAELCNNLDDDCDGRTDGFSRTCGTDVGICEFGAEVCTAGAWSGTCVGAYNGSTEVCNLLDDDCDGSTDEGDPGGGGECGGSVGECLPGIRHCLGGTLVCGGGSEPTPELCDNRDNDCDGFTDEGNPGGGGTCYSGPVGTEGVGVCEGGVERCLGGAIACDGEVLPRPEDCNNLDDDCDGSTDEGLTTGGTCGTDAGECTAGVQDCVAGAWVCLGEVGPGTEICDLLDNDCDGNTDEGNPGGGEPCGWSADPATWDLGICEPGLTDCVAGSLDCIGVIGPDTEECNGLDDDCNGLTDDGLGLGDPCGTDEGDCAPGTMACVDGRTECVGEVGPATEVCDCGDNDCDGSTDEDDPCGGGGAACIESSPDVCTCAELCDPDIEFPCPVGYTCEDGLNPEDPTAYYCVPVSTVCGTVTCNSCERCDVATMECVPDVECPDCQTCNPVTGRCVDDCAGMTCDAPLVCICGTCLEPDCYTTGFECGPTEDCEPDPTTGRGHCVPNDCYEVACAPPQFCRDDAGCSPSTPEGCCHDPCELIDTCPTGQICYDGVCMDDPHLCTPACPLGQACVDGECVDDTCGAVECAWPLECDPDTGRCEEPPCWDLTCPEGYQCIDGTCFENSHPADDQDGGGDGTAADATGSQVIATGAGGCACRASGGSSPGGALGLLGLVGLGLLLRVRRRSSRAAPTPAGRG